MSRSYGKIDALRASRNRHLNRWQVLHIVWEEANFFFFYPGMPEDLLPDFGERFSVLETIPQSVTSTAYHGQTKTTSNSRIRCGNPDNMFGKLLNRTKLLRKAAAKVYTITESLGWDDRETVFRGYIKNVTLADKVSINIRS